MHRYSSILLLVIALSGVVFCGYRAARPEPVRVARRAAYFDADSLQYYADRCCRLDDAEALFLTASAAYLKSSGALPDSLPTVSLPVADFYCACAAAQGHKGAQQAMRHARAEGTWSPALEIEDVPVLDTPWQLAAFLADHPQFCFRPESVEQTTQDRAIIHGWLFVEESYAAEPHEDGRIPAVVLCDLSSGHLLSAHLQCEFLEIE